MRHVRIKHALLVMVAVFLIVGVSLPAGVCYAQRQAKGKLATPEHYPTKFKETGYINRIEKDGIVINDCWYRFSPFAKFSTPTRRNTLRSRFRAGDLVGYIINSKKEIESLWLLKK